MTKLAAVAEETLVRPFEMANVPEVELNDLRRRIIATKYFNAKGVSIPAAVSVFPDELYPAPRSWTERAYPKLIHFNKVEKGGHFAAWEQPQLFSEEVRAGFRSLRG